RHVVVGPVRAVPVARYQAVGICRLDVGGELVVHRYVGEALLLRSREGEAEGQHHDLGYLCPGYGVVRAERAVGIPGHYPGAVEVCHLSKVGVVLGYVREAQRTPGDRVACRYAGRLIMLVVAVVAPRLVDGELNPYAGDVGRRVVAEVTADGG